MGLPGGTITLISVLHSALPWSFSARKEKVPVSARSRFSTYAEYRG